MADTDVIKRHPLVEDYLARLQAAARKLPRGERKDLIADTEAYLDQAVKPDASAIEVRGLLGALGTPEALAAQERPKTIKPDPEPTEGSAIILIAVGGLFVGIGWFFGLYLLWRSRVFSVVDKLIGTLLWPGGIASAIVVAIVLLASDVTLGWLIACGVLAVPALTAYYLARRLRRP
jgi:uncharacterized membrane protein